MAINRRQFIKRSLGAVSVGLVLPRLFLEDARAGQIPAAGSSRKIFVVIQLAGGNDGLNTIVPYSDSNYHNLRPRIGFQDSELASTMIDGQFAFHPSMTSLKTLYDAGRVAIVLGVGYPNPLLSHFTSMDVWHTASPTGGQAEGWLGKYADVALASSSSFNAASVGSVLPKTFFSDKVVIPNISTFANYQFLTDSKYPGDKNNQTATFNTDFSRTFPLGSFAQELTSTGSDAVAGASLIQSSITSYSSSVTYPNSPIASGLKMLAQIITTVPTADLLYAEMGGFDNHSSQIGTNANPDDRLSGDHATLLQQFSDGVKAFYDDLTAHSLADDVVIMTWSEFGRRVNDNASNGTDHGTASPLFVIGNPVAGGAFYGTQPSLAPTSLDSAGNMKFTVDFRSVYATILDKWLGADSASVLGQPFPDLGFLG
ncbi:MAG TPA: DUF1501 domain-containing protein [Blastocatellia bacterium]|nr:DUF1501 domain-containing protein [Blastocatellia bacterium]